MSGPAKSCVGGCFDSLYIMLIATVNQKDSSLYRMAHHNLYEPRLWTLIGQLADSHRAFGSSGWEDGHFMWPVSVVLHQRSRRLFVLDQLKDNIQIFSLNGRQWLGKIGSHGQTPLQFNHPEDMVLYTLDNKIYLYVADTYNSRIQVIDVTNKEPHFIREFGNGILRSPSGVTYDQSTGMIFVSDRSPETKHATVFAFDQNDHVQFRVSDDSNKLIRPCHLCVDSVAEELFVADSYTACICVFSTRDGSFKRRFGSRRNSYGLLQSVSGIALCSESTSELIVTDNAGDCLRVIDRRTGAVLRHFGSKGHAVGQFNEPEGICVDPTSETIYICDAHNRRVQILCNI